MLTDISTKTVLRAEQEGRELVLDASGLDLYKSCPFKFWLTRCLGLTPDVIDQSPHLVFGKAMHRAMEVLYTNHPDWGDTTLMQAIEAFNDEINTLSDVGLLPVNKRPEEGHKMILRYVSTWGEKDRDIQVLFTEVGGNVLITPTISIKFRIDAIIRDKYGINILEHKTASQVQSTADISYNMSTQIGIYLHALNCYYQQEEINGAIVNILVFRKTNPECIRLIVNKDNKEMQRVVRNNAAWAEALMSDVHNYKEGRLTFKMNETSCSNYFGCPFYNVCRYGSIESLMSGEIPHGYRIEFWNPDEHIAVNLLSGRKEVKTNGEN